MATHITRCTKTIGRGTCRNEALYSTNGSPTCPEHTPEPSDDFDVMPLHGQDAPDALPKCGCGCGAQVQKKGRLYLQGHDMKHKSVLLRRVREMADADAGRTLVQKGWKERADMEQMLAEAVERTGGVVNSEEDPDDETDRPIDHMGLRHDAEPTAPRVSRGRSRRAEPQASASA